MAQVNDRPADRTDASPPTFALLFPVDTKTGTTHIVLDFSVRQNANDFLHNLLHTAQHTLSKKS